MTTPDATYLILFAANLAFIVTHLYGWLLKWFYKPKAYREYFHEFFPAQRSVGVIYLLQLFELPYLLQIGDRDALLYVNAFSLLFFSIQMLIMCDGYFFPSRHNRRREVLLFLPAAVVLAPLFLQAVDIISMPQGWRIWMVGWRASSSCSISSSPSTWPCAYATPCSRPTKSATPTATTSP